jgi:hypothetical protein
MMDLLDEYGRLLVPLLGFLAGFVLCYQFGRLGWVWPTRAVLGLLLVAGAIFLIQAFQAEDDDWSGIFLVLAAIFVVAPTWLGGVIGAVLGRYHQTRAKPDRVSPR